MGSCIKKYNKATRYIFGFGKFPDNWRDFIELMKEIIPDNWLDMYVETKENLKEYITDNSDNERKKYLYCSVEFLPSSRKYYYFTDDDNIQVDDYVIVPVGKNDEHKRARIHSIQCFSESEVPFPLEKIKHIICDCTEDVIKEIEEEKAIEIINPYNNENNILIVLEGTFSLFYRDWYTHYEPYEYDYQLFINRIKQI